MTDIIPWSIISVEKVLTFIIAHKEMEMMKETHNQTKMIHLKALSTFANCSI